MTVHRKEPRSLWKPCGFIPRPAFTLVEVMLATLLGGVVLSVASFIAVDTLRARAIVTAELAERRARSLPFDQFQEDISLVISWLPGVGSAIELHPANDRLISIIALADGATTDSLFRRRLPAKISYLVREDPELPGSKQLLREVVYLTDAARRPSVHTLARHLHAVAVEMYRDASGWVSEPTRDQRSDGPPKAVRLRCEWTGSNQRRGVRTVFVPGAWPEVQ